MVRVLSLAVLTAFVACGDDTDQPGASLDPADSVALTIAVGTSEVVGALLATLQVDAGAATGTGFLAADPSNAAGVLDDPSALQRLVDGASTEQVCSEQYGGPDVAHIIGSVGETAVDTTIDRANGCGIAAWELLQPLLPQPLWSADATATATYGDATQPVRRHTAERFTIRLASNPTTGFEWQVTVPSEAVVALVSTAYEGPEGELVGAGGTDVFEFEATGAGVATIEFAYVRPFEEGTPPAETRSIHVEVGPG